MDTARKNYLFQRYFDRTVSREEREELLNWIRGQEDKDIIGLMDRAWEDFNGQGIVFTEEQSERMIRSVLQGAAPGPAMTGEGGVWKRTGRVIAVAVVMLAAVLVITWALLSPQTGNRLPLLSQSQPENDVSPGTSKAVLTLAGGATIVLDSAHGGIVATQGKTKVMKLKGGKLAFIPAVILSGKKNSRPAHSGYNVLTTPRGGQYELQLPDGSRVWLNAASSLKFPAAFDRRERRVELKGDAYFEIAPESGHPFFVSVSGFSSTPVSVRALGTHFDISAYTDAPAIVTTLLQGSVQMTCGDEKTVLRPEQQARIRPGAKEIEVTKAKIEDAVAWKNGLFYFDGDDIGTIMREIKRWYDVSVRYENGVPPGHFTGIISRNTNLSEVLKMLALTGVHFRLQGREIIVTP